MGLVAEANCTWCVAGKYQTGSGVQLRLASVAGRSREAELVVQCHRQRDEDIHRDREARNHRSRIRDSQSWLSDTADGEVLNHHCDAKASYLDSRGAFKSFHACDAVVCFFAPSHVREIHSITDQV